MRVAKDSTGHQALRVKRVGGAAGGLCDSPHPRLQSLGVSQELSLASSDFLEVALDGLQLLQGLTSKHAVLVAESADGLHLDAWSDVHLDLLRLADMPLIQSAVLFNISISVVGRVVDDEIYPRLMNYL